MKNRSCIKTGCSCTVEGDS